MRHLRHMACALNNSTMVYTQVDMGGEGEGAEVVGSYRVDLDGPVSSLILAMSAARATTLDHAHRAHYRT